ncbi:MAG: NAD(P)H-binding protein [Myxococcota bacterium]
MGRVLVLGARGRMGRWAVHAFRAAGWTVKGFIRKTTASIDETVECIQGDALNPADVRNASRDIDIIVNALNQPYELWASTLPQLTNSVIEAAKSTGATVVLPGNVYNYGISMPPKLKEDTPHRPSTRKGQLREDMEQKYRNSGVQTLILRAGDFIEPNRTGNWFDTYISPNIHDGVLTYPGPTNIAHAWAYLPDVARAMVELANIRKTLPTFESVGFPGHTISGEQLRYEAIDLLDRPVRIKSFPWWLLAVIAPFRPRIREVLEMRYLWNIPHEIDGTRFRQLRPTFESTPMKVMLRNAWGLSNVAVAQ